VVELKNGTVELSDPEAVVTGIVGSIETAIGAMITWKVLGPKITAAVKGLFGSASLASIGTTIGTALSSGWTAITGALAAIPVWGWIASAVVALIAGAIGLSLVDYDFTDVGKKLGKALGKVADFAMEWLNPDSLGQKFHDWFYSVDWDNLGENVMNWLTDAVVKADTWWEDTLYVGRNIVAGIEDGIKEGWDNLIENIGEFFTGLFDGFCEEFDINSPAKKMNPIGKYIVEGIWEGFTSFDILKKIQEWGGKVTSGIGSLFNGGNSKSETVDVKVNLVKNGWSTVTKWIGNIPGVSQAVSLVKSGWKSIKAWIGNLPSLSQGISLAKSGWTSVTKWIGSIPTLSAGIKLVKSGWTTIKNWLGNLNFNLGFKLPKIGINWGTKKVLGFQISYPSSFYTYAKGGFPDMGEMFIAREAGPEMVGKIGNKTTVANNEQIVEGISEGVYTAVLAAMRASQTDGGQSVNVYLDGRMVTRSVEKHQRERGTSFVGRQAYSY
jgi:hypothetical protein